MRQTVDLDPFLPFPSKFYFLLDCGQMAGSLAAILRKEATFSSRSKDGGQNKRFLGV